MKSKRREGDNVDVDFDQLYNTYYMKVYSFAVTLARNQSVAEEITQNTFFKAMVSYKQHRGESSEFTWLCAIAKNLLTDEQRAHRRFGEIDTEVAADNNIEQALVDEDMALCVHQILHGLDEPYKEVFQLRVFGELTFQKIGLILGKTENWARVTYHRARLKIQERMDVK